MKKQFKVFVKKLLSLVLISFSAVTIADVKAGFEGKTAELSLIISNTDTSRRKGLMHQSVLGKNTGMWMKNTSLSLSVAYLSQDGKILEIYDMVPFSEQSICSTQKVRMALEVNQGWFKKNKILIGDKINF